MRRRDLQALGNGFSTVFQFRYADLGGVPDDSGNAGSNGIAFTIQPEGSGMPRLVGAGVSVWFDAYRDGPDVSSSRVGVYRNGAQIAQFDVEALGIRYRDGGEHIAQIDYQASSLFIRLDGQPVGTVKVNVGNSGLVGFACLNLQAYANQDLLNWSFQSTALQGAVIAVDQCGRIFPTPKTSPFLEVAAKRDSETDLASR